MDYFEILHDESPYQEEYFLKISEKSEKQDGRGGQFEKKNLTILTFLVIFSFQTILSKKKIFLIFTHKKFFPAKKLGKFSDMKFLCIGEL